MLKGCLQFLRVIMLICVKHIVNNSLWQQSPLPSPPSLTDLILCHFSQLGLLCARFYILRHVHPSVYPTVVRVCLWLRWDRASHLQTQPQLPHLGYVLQGPAAWCKYHTEAPAVNFTHVHTSENTSAALVLIRLSCYFTLLLMQFTSISSAMVLPPIPL